MFKRSYGHEEGASTLEMLLASLVLFTIIFVSLAIFAYSYSMSFSNMKVQEVADLIEGQRCLWENQPSNTNDVTDPYNVCLSNLRTSAASIVSDARGVKDSVALNASSFAVVEPGHSAYFHETGEIYSNNTFICADPNEIQNLLTGYAPSQPLIFCDTSSTPPVNVSVSPSNLSSALNNPSYSPGKCNSCIANPGLSNRQLVSRYPTEVVAYFENPMLPILSFLPDLKVKKLVVPKVLTSASCNYTFAWQGSWGPCQGVSSCTASTGTQYLVGECWRTGCSQPSIQVGSSFCDPATDPSASQTCTIPALPADGTWTLSSWVPAQCPQICGQGGKQTRTVTCNGQCCPPPKPDETQACPVIPFNGSWVPGAWSACSIPAGQCSGTKTRSYTCNGSCCQGPQPANDTDTCSITDPWMPGTWSECVGACGNPGTQTRSYTCGGTGQCCPSPQPGDDSQNCQPVCNPTCVYVAAWAICSGTTFTDVNGHVYNCSNGGYSQLTNMASNYTVTDPHTAPACFGDIVSGGCRSQNDDGNGVSRWGWCNGDGTDGFCVDDNHNGVCDPTDRDYNSLTPRILARFLGDPNWASLPNGATYYNHKAMSYTAYMDENCNFLSRSSQPANTKICGFLGTSFSPISLLWTSDASVEGSGPVINFALNPNKPDLTLSVWKASAETPLLVHDPKHTGVITSAEQLFGNYTFGGKVVDLAKAVFDKGSHLGKEPWKNGYDALALFDLNRDGEISGQELEPLALWFDKNRNGISEPGEVRTLLDEGVVALYYNYDREDKVTKNVYASKGFKRRIGEKIEVGATVDWYSESFASKQDAVNGLTGKSFSEDSSSNPKVWTDESLSKLEKLGPQVGPDLQGIWAWHVLEKGGEKAPGFFAINDLGNAILGTSAVEFPLAPNSRKLRSSVRYLPLKGNKRLTADNKVVIDMEIVDTTNGITANSVVTVDPSGDRLNGTTKQTFTATKDNKDGSVEYAWEAVKVKPR